MKQTMKIEVTVRSITERPSGHKPSTFFSGGINHKETFTCKHAKQHALLFTKILDLSAQQCGIEKGEFPKDQIFTQRMNKLIADIEGLHKYVLIQQASWKKAKTTTQTNTLGEIQLAGEEESL